MDIALRNAAGDLQDRLKSPLIWVMAVMLPILVLSVFYVTKDDDLFLLFMPSNIIIFILFFLGPVPWQIRKDRLKMNGVFSSVILYSCIILLLTIAFYFSPLKPRHGWYENDSWNGFLKYFFSNIIIYFPIGWLQAYILMMKEREKSAIHRLQRVSWMRYSQYGNSLGSRILAKNLQYLEDKDINESEEMVDHLILMSSFYRQWLNMVDCPVVSLEEERYLLEIYEEMEQQFGLNISWDWNVVLPIFWTVA